MGFRKVPSMGLMTGTGNNSAKKKPTKTYKARDLGRNSAWDLRQVGYRNKNSAKDARKDNARDLGTGNNGIYDRYRKTRPTSKEGQGRVLKKGQSMTLMTGTGRSSAKDGQG